MSFVGAVTTLLPSWLIFIYAGLVFTHRIYVVLKWNFVEVNRLENLFYSIALLMVTLFYGVRSLGFEDFQVAIALSRIVFMWWLTASLYISHRMAYRRKKNGLE